MAWIVSVLTDSVVVISVLGVVGWLSREWIATRLKASIQLESEKQLATFKKRLDAAEAEVHVIRQAGLDAARASGAAILAERVTAAKALWQGINGFGGSIIAVSTIVAAMTLDWVDKSADHKGTRESMRQLLDATNYKDVLTRVNALSSHRLFVTDRAWALFAAFRGFYAVRISKAFLIGAGGAEYARRMWLLDTERKLINELCPRMLPAYDQNPVAVETDFPNYLSGELLVELQRSLSGDQSGPDAVRQAAAISAITQQAMREAQKAQQPAVPDLPAPAVPAG